jgi:hypothetical protein
VKGELRLGLVDRVEHQVAAFLPDQIEFAVVAADGDVVTEIGFNHALRSGHDDAPKNLLKEHDVKQPHF